MLNDKLSFLSNDIKGIKASEKRLKLFKYFRNLSTPAGFVFLQEIQSSVDVEKKWNDDFQGQLFFSHGKTNSCGVTIGYYGRKSFQLLSKSSDKSGRVLIVEVKIETKSYY